tara:strand:+ start:1509 stop:1907 length:399 start_codon:yes stop_codon:yes gene_type:complete
MVWQMSKEQVTQLEELESSARYVSCGDHVTCELMDDRTGKPWCRADAFREPEALTEALKVAGTTARETSVGTAMIERDRLKSENDRLLKMLDEKKSQEIVEEARPESYDPTGSTPVRRGPGRPRKKPATAEV